MKLNNEELNIILDGLTDTKIRLKNEMIKESLEYKTKLSALTRRVERQLKNKRLKISPSLINTKKTVEVNKKWNLNT